ncbi:hypothetical protein KKG46_00835 [Patescibacteria group bacterium]|nr:hypothetical protein [Patescibacteria group bacterium]
MSCGAFLVSVSNYLQIRENLLSGDGRLFIAYRIERSGARYVTEADAITAIENIVIKLFLEDGLVVYRDDRWNTHYIKNRTTEEYFELYVYASSYDDHAMTSRDVSVTIIVEPPMTDKIEVREDKVFLVKKLPEKLVTELQKLNN